MIPYPSGQTSGHNDSSILEVWMSNGRVRAWRNGPVTCRGLIASAGSRWRLGEWAMRSADGHDHGAVSAGEPVPSVDTKKTEPVRQFKNGGKVRPKGNPSPFSPRLDYRAAGARIKGKNGARRPPLRPGVQAYRPPGARWGTSLGTRNAFLAAASRTPRRLTGWRPPKPPAAPRPAPRPSRPTRQPGHR
jgi:hypothetical protein